MPFSPGGLFVAFALAGALFLLLSRRTRSKRAGPSVDPFFSFLLAADRLTSPLRPNDGNIARYREEVDLASRLVLPFFPRDIKSEDIIANQGGRSIPLRLYAPKERKSLPLVLYFHGGGWVSGSLDSHEGICRALSAASGCAIVAVAYTLAPEARFPTPIEEGLAVLAWIARMGARFGLDPNRVVVAGDSAGAAIAAALCLALRDPGSADLPSLAGQVLFVPVTDLSRFDSDSYRRFGHGYMLTEASIRWFRDIYLDEPAQASDPLASPLRASSLEGLPPAFIVSAGLDPLASDGAEYAARLRAAGVAAEYLRIPGVLHAFIGVPTRPGREVIMRAGAWIAARLGLDEPRRETRRRRPADLSARGMRRLPRRRPRAPGGAS